MTVAVMTMTWLVEGAIVPSRAMPVQDPWATVSSVQVAPVRYVSSGSTRLAPTASDGPLLVTVMV